MKERVVVDSYSCMRVMPAFHGRFQETLSVDCQEPTTPSFVHIRLAIKLKVVVGGASPHLLGNRH